MFLKFCSVSLLCAFAFMACNKPDNANCVETPAGSNFKFRFTDTSGNELLAGPQHILFADSLNANQPCSTGNLVNIFSYAIAGKDTSVMLHFENFQTPDYGADGNCFRVLFHWTATDVDTLDWHYKVELSGSCKQEIVDYLSYNGLQAKYVPGSGADYYQCVKL